LRTDADCVGLRSTTCVDDINIEVARGEIMAGTGAQADVAGAGVAKECALTDGRVAAESNTIRIGGDIGFGPQTATFIAGIRSVTTLTGTLPVVIDANGQLGVGSNIVVSSNSASSSRFKQEMKAMKATVAELKSVVAKQQAIITQQKTGMEAVTARLDEQQAQIQKVSARIEVSKPAPQTVLNNQ